MSRPARGQSNVVGVALLLAVTVVALGALTATIGGVVGQHAASANAARVAADLDDALRPVEVTGSHRGRISFTAGELSVVERDLRVLDEGGVVETVAVGGLVFESGRHRVGFVAGGLVRGRDEAAFRSTPPVTAGEEVLLVGAPALDTTSGGVSATGRTTVTLRTDVEHHRRALGEGTWRVAVETTTPAPWERYFERLGATVVATDREFDGDGVGSVVARFPGDRTAYLVVHAMHLEVVARG